MTKIAHLALIIKTKRFVLISIILLIIFGLFYWNTRTKTESLQLAEVKRQTIKQTVSTSGILTGKESVNLRFKSSGKLSYLNVKVGDSVKKGQVIAGLDTADLSISLKQAQNTLEEKQAALRKVLDDIHQYQYGNGGSSNVGSANETETQRAIRIAAEQAANNAYDNVKSAQVALNDTAITSPLDGIVTLADPIPGQVVTFSDVIAQVIDDSQIYFEAEVDEGDIGKISIGQKADVTLNSHPDQIFLGTVEQILPATKTTSSGATVIVTKISLANPVRLIANINGQASIITNQKSNILTIPIESLVDDEHVYISKNTKPELIKIKTGISSDTDIEVLEGLNEGDHVVINPSAIKK